MEKKIFWIDLFSGAGGTSTGVFLAGEKVIACVNHDANALRSHKLNHPNCFHFTEDIRDFKVVQRLKVIVDRLRKRYPGCIINIWASLECTNYSIAKGGQPKDADSRTLAHSLYMYTKHLNPDYLYIENVREFKSWGPLDTNGRPISRKNGIDYIKWCNTIQSFGYDYDHKLLNAADFGGFTSRIRYFGQFALKGSPISWPEPTHTKTPFQPFGLFEDHRKPWNPVKEVLDLQDEGRSIFNRKKPLVDNTIKVILKGLTKALKEKEDAFLFKYYGNGDNLNSINDPAGTITTKDRFAKVQLIFNQYKTGNTSSIDKPLGSVTTTPKANLVSFIMNPSHRGHTTSIEKPSPVVIARQDKAPLYLIRALMDKNGIVDIKMRMLKIPELLKIQGFPDDYKLVGTKTEQKKFIGNAVEVNQAKAIIESNRISISKLNAVAV